MKDKIISIRIDEETEMALQKIMKDQNRGRSNLIQSIIKEFVENYNYKGKNNE